MTIVSKRKTQYIYIENKIHNCVYRHVCFWNRITLHCCLKNLIQDIPAHLGSITRKKTYNCCYCLMLHADCSCWLHPCNVQVQEEKERKRLTVKHIIKCPPGISSQNLNASEWTTPGSGYFLTIFKTKHIIFDE